MGDLINSNITPQEDLPTSCDNIRPTVLFAPSGSNANSAHANPRRPYYIHYGQYGNTTTNRYYGNRYTAPYPSYYYYGSVNNYRRPVPPSVPTSTGGGGTRYYNTRTREQSTVNNYEDLLMREAIMRSLAEQQT